MGNDNKINFTYKPHRDCDLKDGYKIANPIWVINLALETKLREYLLLSWYLKNCYLVEDDPVLPDIYSLDIEIMRLKVGVFDEIGIDVEKLYDDADDDTVETVLIKFLRDNCKYWHECDEDKWFKRFNIMIMDYIEELDEGKDNTYTTRSILFKR